MTKEDKKLLNSIADRLDYQYENPNNDVSIILKYCSKSLRNLVKKLNIDDVSNQRELLIAFSKWKEEKGYNPIYDHKGLVEEFESNL